MKKEGHPAYQDILFVDTATGHKFVCGSTLQPKETEEFEGKTYPVYRVPISSSSHPFFTGSQQFVDSEGRVDKFKKRYTSSATPLVDPKIAKKEALQKASSEAKEKVAKDSKEKDSKEKDSKEESSKEEKKAAPKKAAAKKPATKKAAEKKPAAKKAPAKKAPAKKEAAAKKEEKAEDKKTGE